MSNKSNLEPFEVALTEQNLIVMIAICAIYDRCGRVTYRSIRDQVNKMTGSKSVSCAHYHQTVIPKLKKLGWIKFDITKQGTIVPIRRFEFFPESIGIKKNVSEANSVQDQGIRDAVLVVAQKRADDRAGASEPDLQAKI